MGLYHKPTDTQRYLLYSASHIKHCLKNIPFVMARPICTRVENNSLKEKHLRELKENVRTYGFPKKLLKLEYKKHQKFLKWNYGNLEQLKITII